VKEREHRATQKKIYISNQPSKQLYKITKNENYARNKRSSSAK
jgi:hypothetical protein